MQKTWLVQQLHEKSEVIRLQEELKVPQLISQLLLQRGITTFDAARSFFRPELSDLHDPFLMKGMYDAVERLEKVKSNKEKILVFGDYDVDGTTAVALMSLFLKHTNFIFEYYIPDRYKEGYGISIEGIDYAKQQDCKLIIALDCGITAVDKVDYAKELGIDFIICDHHLPGKKVPNAIVLDPKQDDCAYPYKELSGCGLGFKLAQAYIQKMKLSTDFLYGLLDLVAIAIAADIVPVTGENRILAYHGLELINSKNQRKGLQALLKSANKESTLTLTNVVFILAPRINAAGRIDTGKNAVELLLSEEKSQLNALSEKIEQDNALRKELDRDITEEILEQSLEIENFDKRHTTVVYGENWHKGVIGIVASRIMETYYRPTVILTSSGESASGSVRSVSGFNVYEALDKCSSLLIQFGGHAAAAGLSIELDNIPAFIEKFEKVVSESISKEQLDRKERIDAEISFKDIFSENETPSKIPKIKRLLNEFEPTGPGNMKPVFLAKNIYIDPDNSRVVGDNHYKMSLYQADSPYKIPAIGFNLGYKINELGNGEPVDIIFTLEENTWQERTTLQLNVKDIRTTLVPC